MAIAAEGLFNTRQDFDIMIINIIRYLRTDMQIKTETGADANDSCAQPSCTVQNDENTLYMITLYASDLVCAVYVHPVFPKERIPNK